MALEIRQYCSAGGALSSLHQPPPSFSGLGRAPSGWNSPDFPASYKAMAWLVGNLAPCRSPMASQSWRGMALPKSGGPGKFERNNLVRRWAGDVEKH
eukprot:3348290-Pyramimonas_sp.AAC.1